MDYTKVAVLGGGAIGLATSVDFFNAGFEVNLFELPKFKETIVPIMEKKQLEYTGAAGDKTCNLNMVTTDIKQAIEDVGLIVFAIPAFAHEPFMKACLPHLQDGQIILVETGYFASIRFAKDIKNTGKKVILSEFNSTPYCCRKRTPVKIFIDEKRTELLLAALPATDTPKVLEVIQKVYPKTTAVPNVIMTSLDLVNFIIHPPVTLFHKGLLERSKEYALPVKDSIPPSVVTYMDAMENERIAVGKAYGFDLPPIKHFYELGGDTLEDALRKSKEWQTYDFEYTDATHQYLVEDMYFALPPLISLGVVAGVPAPATSAITEVFSIIDGVDYMKEGLSVEKMGMAGMNVQQILEVLEKGF